MSPSAASVRSSDPGPVAVLRPADRAAGAGLRPDVRAVVAARAGRCWCVAEIDLHGHRPAAEGAAPGDPAAADRVRSASTCPSWCCSSWCRSAICLAGYLVSRPPGAWATMASRRPMATSATGSTMPAGDVRTPEATDEHPADRHRAEETGRGDVMPLTPEDVANKQFTSTRLKPGYDETEVDEFLDEVEAELTRLYRENDELRSKLAAAGRGEPRRRHRSPPRRAAAARAETEQRLGRENEELRAKLAATQRQLAEAQPPAPTQQAAPPARSRPRPRGPAGRRGVGDRHRHPGAGPAHRRRAHRRGAHPGRPDHQRGPHPGRPAQARGRGQAPPDDRLAGDRAVQPRAQGREACGPSSGSTAAGSSPTWRASCASSTAAASEAPGRQGQPGGQGGQPGGQGQPGRPGSGPARPAGQQGQPGGAQPVQPRRPGRRRRPAERPAAAAARASPGRRRPRLSRPHSTTTPVGRRGSPASSVCADRRVGRPSCGREVSCRWRPAGGTGRGPAGSAA